ncbi:Adaptive-response sensory-kinase SasA [Xanthomonas hydrangeae]|uniref:PAS domain-containing sensor histidine kinase n=1 Tax=Xanthomonas hydrangeae TaxID=2775159 RepID=UPI001964BA76|nr:Adaptive-response sensory-kinase SasA [Xanthomonas hydrangeae]CAD7721783.1 Adaptive-response sensory-kinase SasA [Xanthomonas hydrangeae]CAD7737912.1 Adaptive-response sensory-kinase SasA [Xanthomonas hydrangeae]CAD7737915.1 Adaptive-response sensory-kinase SasA [Xanthomonas hydrangeae]CAD7738581.1 Adaptive-response sensory-kinase SasA [Xanthomonas hydrangeae]
MRDRYRQIVALSRDCIKEIDLDGRITAINVNGLAGLGVSHPDQLISQPWRDLWPPEAVDLVDAAIAGSTNGLIQEFEAACVNFAGVRQTWQVVTSPLFDAFGNVEAILAVSKNISDRRTLEAAFHTLDSMLKAEREFSTGALMLARARENSLSTELHTLRDRQERIEGDLDIARAAQGAAEKISEQAQKGEAVGQLLAGVVHDLNNVLQAATSAIDLVVQRARIDAHDARLLSVADAALQHGSVMAQRLVGFSRQYPYSPEAVDLAALAEQLSPLLEQVIGAELQLQLRTSEGGCCAMVDRHTVERAILNLVINSRDACKSGDTIRIETGDTVVAAEDASLSKPGGHYVTITVADSGHGMDAGVQSRLFEAYFTTKDAGKGAGLGLTQVYSAVRQAGGFVEVSSAPGKGARFLLAFPRMQRSQTSELAASP